MAYLWPVNEDFYDAFESGASTVLANPAELERVVQLRMAAGIVL